LEGFNTCGSDGHIMKRKMTWIKVGVVIVQFILALAALFSDDVQKPIKYWFIGGLFLLMIFSI
jgi:hypothetical protein